MDKNKLYRVNLTDYLENSKLPTSGCSKGCFLEDMQQRPKPKMATHMTSLGGMHDDMKDMSLDTKAKKGQKKAKRLWVGLSPIIHSVTPINIH